MLEAGRRAGVDLTVVLPCCMLVASDVDFADEGDLQLLIDSYINKILSQLRVSDTTRPNEPKIK